ncbi:MAG: alpha-mannosidase [Clostridia bacterium]|nr:alpha-mannosidase [Clostridia bacterium]
MNGKPKISLIGNAHLDPVWLWRWQEGRGEVMQTFRSALDRLREYPDTVFTCSSAAYYRWVEEIDPGMFAEIRERVKEGRWVPVNGWWVQPDCNLPSGESFARQALYSQLYYYEKFGRICRVGYNVDSFGHNGNMPQLVKLGGMSSYVFLRPDRKENPDIPFAFNWEGTDGTTIPAYKVLDLYCVSGAENIDSALAELTRIGAEGGHGVMLFYGVGNHGGGPTKADIEHLEELKRNGFSELEFSSPEGYFASLGSASLPTWRGELQHHASGCYSVTGMIKALNRRAENSLYASEAFATVAGGAGMGEKTADYREAWREVCFNQFHDILCGCAIKEAYTDAADSVGGAVNVSEKLYNEALLRVSRRVDTWLDGVSEPRERNYGSPFPRPFVVFNPLPFAVKTTVRISGASKRVTDENGADVPFGSTRSSRMNDSHLDTVFTADLPALGYATYWATADAEAHAKNEKPARPDELTLENEYIRAVFDEKTGYIISLTDKASGFDYASPERPAAVPVVLDDTESDTWAHGVFRFDKTLGTPELCEIEVAERTPAREIIRVKHAFKGSSLTQEFILARGVKTLRVRCKAFWNEPHTILKTSFPYSGSGAENICEIPCGFIKRPPNGEEWPLQKWCAVSFNNGGRRTLALMSDSKYSCDCPEGELRLTLIRNAIFADHFSDRPFKDYDYTDEGVSRFEYGVYLSDGSAEKTEVTREALKLNIRPVAIPEGYHKGEAPRRASFLSVSAENVVMTALKRCEDGSGDAVIRLYETRGEAAKAHITCAAVGADFDADFRPNEIKTFRISASGQARETDFLEGAVPADARR